MKTILDELVTVLGFETEGDAAVKAYKKELAGLGNLAKKVAAGIAAAGAAIVGISVTTANRVDDLATFADAVDDSFQSLQELEFVAGQTNGTLGGLQGTISSLNNVLGEARRGTGAGLEVFGRLGIDTNQIENGTHLLTVLQSRFQSFDKETQIDFARKLGITDDMFGLLDLTTSEFNRLRGRARELGIVLDNEAAAKADIFVDTMNEAKLVIRAIKDQIAFAAIPVIKDVTARFVEWLLVNREIIQQRLEEAIEKVLVALGLLWRIVEFGLGVMSFLIEKLGTAERAFAVLRTVVIAFIALRLAGFLIQATLAMRAFGIAALLTKIGLLLLPIAIAAVIIALAFLLNEIFVFVKGGKSFLGDFVNFIRNEFPTLYGVITRVGDLFQAVGEVFSNFLTVIIAGVQSVIALFTLEWDKLPGLTDTAVNSMLNIFDSLFNFLSNGAFSFRDVWQGAINWVSDKIEGFFNLVQRAKDKVTGFFGDDDVQNIQQFSRVGLPGQALAGIPPRQFGGGISNRSVRQGDVNLEAHVNVNGTQGSGRQVGQQIATGMVDQTRRLKRGMTSRVKF